MGKYKNNPWLGLESYRENQIIYGRNKEIEELSQCVLNNNETVLYGKSGIGKSSIINAGIIPVVRAHGYLPIVVRLDHSNKHSYIKQISDLIVKDAQVSECSTAKPIEEQLLWEYFHTHRFNKTKEEKSKLVVIFDQFEEIFTLQNNATTKGQFFKELGDVLNNVMPKELTEEQPIETTEIQSCATKQDSVSGFADMADLFSSLAATVNNSANKYIEDNDIHFVFTLREDFLSEFEYHTSKIPSLKQHRYGLRPLNEEQAAEIILKPRPELVDEGVARIIIETVTNRTDFSLGDEPEIDVDAAVLSLFLNQIYDKRDTEDSPISVNLVKTFGRDIIKDFYEESIGELSPKQIDFLEEELLTGENRRDSLSRSDFKAGGFSEAELKRLIDDKKLLRQFHYEGDLRIEFIHDILCPVVKERKEQREMLRQQEAERIRQEEEKRKLQEEADRKQRVLEEKAARERTEAERKQKELEEKAAREKLEAELRQKALEEKAARERLEAEIKQKEIEDKARQERAALEAEAKRIKARNKRRIISVGFATFGLLLLFGIGWFVDWDRNERVFNDYYKDFENIKGWPKGIGNQLSTEECKSTPLYYKLSYKGRKNKGHYTDVEIMSSNANLPNDCRISSIEWSDAETKDEKAQKLNEILSKVERLHYSATEGDTTIAREDFIGQDSLLLMTISYFHTSKNDAVAQYLTPDGENMKIRSNNIDRVKINWDELGRVISVSYSDNQGVQQSIIEQKEIYGYLWDYSKKDTIIKYSLNAYGLPTSAVKANTLMTINRNDSVVTVFANSAKVYQSKLTETECDRGYSREIKLKNKIILQNAKKSQIAERIIEKDALGNIKSITTNGNSHFGYPEIERYEYNKGRLILKEYLTMNRKPFEQTHNSIYKWQYQYDGKGEVVEEKHFDGLNTLAYHHKISEIRTGNGKVRTDLLIDITKTTSYLERVDSIIGNHTTSSYYGVNHTPINSSHTIGTDTLSIHKVILTSDNVNHSKTWELFVFDGNNIIEMPDSIRDGYAAVGYFKRTEEYDDAGNVLSKCLENAKGEIIKNMIYYYQGGKCIGRAAKGLSGKPVRCDKWEEEGLLYYKLYFAKDVEKVFTSLMAVDEWDNRSSIFNGEIYLYMYRQPFKNMAVRVYENFEEAHSKVNAPFVITPIYNSYIQSIFMEDPEVIKNTSIPYIHILSDTYSKYNQEGGFKDGDRIVRLGNWKLGQSYELLTQEWRKTFYTDTKTAITVLRPEDNGLIKTDFTYVGRNNDVNKIHYHIQCLTKSEKQLVKYIN